MLATMPEAGGWFQLRKSAAHDAKTAMKQTPEANQPAIKKGVGLTSTERYLARLAERSFLNLWSYPNAYRDQGRPGSGDGKELCDLLVVCGQHIIVFSEKNINWPNGDVTIAWRRWAKRALLDSTKQVRGAERWITQFPDRIFLDHQCTRSFPIDLPTRDEAVIHRIVVARGAGEACKRHFRDGMGSLRVRTDVQDDRHFSPVAYLFTVGDLDPKGSFVHVLDDVTLNILLGELDTIVDFTSYLTKKAAFVRSGSLRSAAGEQDLLAHYAVRVNDHGDHDFTGNGGYGGPFDLQPGLYQRLVRDRRYVARKQADRIAYVWDRLIETFTGHMIDGTSMVLDGYPYDIRQNELGVRHMALQRRVARRTLGAAVGDALFRGAVVDRFFRRMIMPAGSPEGETGFFVHTVKYPDAAKGGYDEYRRSRATMAWICAQGVLLNHPHLARVVGISCEPAAQGRGGSEDLVYAEQAQWSDHDRATIREDCRRLGVMQPGRREHHWHEEEFPDI